MMSESRSRLVAAACLVLAILLGGCGGPKKVKVRGTLTRNGQPLNASTKTLVTITFAPLDQAAGQTYPAKFKHAEGAYEVTVPTGKYRVGLIVVPPDGAAPLRSPIDASKTYDIQKEQEIDLDLSE